jgi:hypothetical protein
MKLNITTLLGPSTLLGLKTNEMLVMNLETITNMYYLPLKLNSSRKYLSTRFLQHSMLQVTLDFITT